MCVHAGGAGHSIIDAGLELVELLHAFARPTDDVAVIDEVEAGARTLRAARVAELRRVGALVECDAGTGAAAATAEHETILAQLSSLAELLPRLAGDVATLGPEQAERALALTGVSLGARVSSLVAAATALAAEMSARREVHVTRALDRLRLDPESRPLLHVGSGEHPLPGWLNVDVHPADLPLDVRWGLPFADGAVHRIFMCHVLEHLYYPDEAVAVLADLRRALSRDGVLRIVVPDIGQSLRAYIEQDDAFFAARRATWHWWPEGGTRLGEVLSYAGAGARPGAFFESHKFGYDFDTLRHALVEAGFTRVERSGYMASAHAELRVDDTSPAASARHPGGHYSLFAEASGQLGTTRA